MVKDLPWRELLQMLAWGIIDFSSHGGQKEVAAGGVSSFECGYSSHLIKTNCFPDFQAHGVGVWCPREGRFF